MTRQQQAVLKCIKNYIFEYGRQPTLDEIGSSMKLVRSTVHGHVSQLIEKSHLGKGVGKVAYCVPDDFLNTGRLPLLGVIAAGLPIEAISNQDDIDVSAHFCGPDRYVLKVSGNSMIEAGILDGDYVVLQKQDVANDGDTVVALINQWEATLKYIFVQNDGNIELRPANSSMESMFYPADQVRVQGVMVGLFRNHPQLP